MRLVQSILLRRRSSLTFQTELSLLAGDQYVLINNDLADAISGTFANAPAGTDTIDGTRGSSVTRARTDRVMILNYRCPRAEHMAGSGVGAGRHRILTTETSARLGVIRSRKAFLMLTF